MSVQEIESEVAKLAPADFATFAEWFEEFAAQAWDRQLEADVAAGKLDHLAKRADADFEAGKCELL